MSNHKADLTFAKELIAQRNKQYKESGVFKTHEERMKIVAKNLGIKDFDSSNFYKVDKNKLDIELTVDF